MTNSTNSTLAQIAQWFEKAVPQPILQNDQSQTGCHLEEFAEMVNAFGTNQVGAMASFHAQIVTMADAFKRGDIKILQDEQDDIEILDALCDQIVTAIGMAHMKGYDIIGALAQVNASNWSKFDENGNPIFNENQKIMKGLNYFKPNLEKFVVK